MYYTDGKKQGPDWVWAATGQVIDVQSADWTTYSKPVPGQHAPTAGNCLAINTIGKKSWHRIPCHKQLMYVCEF
jgi:hypothetical protein